MTEDVNNYTFDFEKEVHALQQFVGAPADKFIFVDLGIDPDNPDPFKRPFARQILARDNKLYCQEKNKIDSDLQKFAWRKDSYASPIIAWDKVEAEAGEDEDKRKSLTRAILAGERPDLGGGFKIFIDQNQSISDNLGPKFKEMDKLRTFYHETAHALTVKDLSYENRPYYENVADAYAAILLLRRFGQEAIPFLQLFSWQRANVALSTGKTGHLTSAAIDKIIFDFENRNEDFSGFTAKQAQEKAEDYADRWAPDEEARSKVLSFTADIKFSAISTLSFNPVNWLLKGTKSTGYTPENVALYVAAKNAMYTRHAKRHADDAYPTMTLNPSQNKCLLKRAREMSFSTLFNTTALKAPAEELPTIAEIITPRVANVRGVRP